jgi:hypothetical protein
VAERILYPLRLLWWCIFQQPMMPDQPDQLTEAQQADFDARREEHRKKRPVRK